MPEGSQANREEKRINIMGKIILFLKQTNFNAFAFILLFSPFLMLWQTHCFGIWLIVSKPEFDKHLKTLEKKYRKFYCL